MKTLFLSFCSKDKPITDLVENSLKSVLGNQIRISRYERDVKYRDSFKEFMNKLSEHDLVLTIVSDSYLKSSACLYEVGEVLKDHHFKDKLHFIVLSDKDEKYYTFEPGTKHFPIGADIYSLDGRLKYYDYWTNLNAQTEAKLNSRPVSVRYREESEYIAQKKVSNYDLPIFLDYLRDARSIPLSDLVKTNFMTFIKQMFPDLDLEKYQFKTLDDALTFYIEEIAKATKTDYNQIILRGQDSTHSDAKLVVADKISSHKQHYFQVATNSEISHSIDYGIITNLLDVRKSSKYLQAVLETKSELIVPIKIKDVCVGAINSEAENYNYYTDEIVQNLKNISELLAISLSYLDYHVDMKKGVLPYISLPVDT